MRLLAIGYALPNVEIDNYNPLTAPSYFDYDALFIDPESVTRLAAQLLAGETEFEAFDGRPVINAPTSATAVSAADQLRRRLDETSRLLESGGTVVVVGRPNGVQAGIAGFEGCDRYSWLPAPAGVSWMPPYLRAAEGKTVRITDESSPFASLLRDFRKDISYRAVLDDRQQAVRQAGRVLARGGAGVPIAVQFQVNGGQVIFLPCLPQEIGSTRMEVAQRIVDAVRLVTPNATPVDEVHWARSIAVPGLEQVEAEFEEAKVAASEAEAKLAAITERHDTLRGHRRLLTEEGRPLLEATRDALVLLGFGTRSIDYSAGIEVESEGQPALVECEGSRGEVVEWPYVRLQRRLEQRLLSDGSQPRGIVVVNGQRTRTPEDRESQFAPTLRIACENYRYCLLTSETLFALVQRALGGASEAELSGIRRRMMSANGLLDLAVAVGEAGEEKQSGPIF